MLNLKSMLKGWKKFVLLIVVLISFQSCQTYRNTAEKDSYELMKQAYKLLGKKQYQKSIMVFTQLIEKNPSFVEAYAYRGMCKYFIKDYEGAMQDFNKALEMQPNFAEVYDMRGIVKGELGDSKGACEDWRRAFELGYKSAFMLIKEFCWDEEMERMKQDSQKK